MNLGSQIWFSICIGNSARLLGGLYFDFDKRVSKQETFLGVFVGRYKNCCMEPTLFSCFVGSNFVLYY